MRRKLTLTLFIFAVVVWPVLALAADGTSSASSQVLMWLLGLVASVVLVLIQHAIRKWLAPKVSQDTAALLDKLAAAGVAYAEEKSRAAVKVSGEKLASNEKLESAAAFALLEADKFGLKNVDLERVRKYVEAALSKTREEPLPTPPVPCDTDGKVRKV